MSTSLNKFKDVVTVAKSALAFSPVKALSRVHGDGSVVMTKCHKKFVQ